MRLKTLSNAIALMIPFGLALNIFSLINIGSISITVNLLLAFIFWFFAPFLNLSVWKPLMVPALWVLIGLLTSLFRSLDVSTFTSFIQYTILFTFFVLVYNIEDHSKFRTAWLFVAVSCSIFCIIQLIQIYFGLVVFRPAVTNLQYSTDQGLQRGFDAAGSITNRLRMPSTFAEPSDFGRFLVIAMAFSTQIPRSLLKIILQLVLIFGVSASMSFGAIFIGIFSYFLAFPKYHSLPIFLLMLIFLYLLYDYLPFGISSKIDGFLSGNIFENSARFKYFPDFLGIIAERPLLGGGIGSADNVFSCCVVANFPVNFIGEYGLVGLSLYAVFWIFICYKFFKFKAEVPNYVKFLIFFLLLSLAWKPQLYDWVFWIILAFSLSNINIKHR